jgi:hypothetical protein
VQYSRESRWSWRDEKIVFESRRYFRSSRIVLFFVFHEFSQKENFSNSRLATNIIRDEVNHDERLNENLVRRNIKSRINLRLISHEKAIDRSTTDVRRDKQHLKSHNDCCEFISNLFTWRSMTTSIQIELLRWVVFYSVCS